MKAIFKQALESVDRRCRDIMHNTSQARDAYSDGDTERAKELVNAVADELFSAGQDSDCAMNQLTGGEPPLQESPAPSSPLSINERLAAAEAEAFGCNPRTELSVEERLAALEAEVERRRAAAHQEECTRRLIENSCGDEDKIRRGP